MGRRAGSALGAAECKGAGILGEGSSLQKVAQGVWKTSYEALCPKETTPPVVKYEPSGSGIGLNTWGASGLTTLKNAKGELVHFVGTDDAPTNGQIASIGKSFENTHKGASANVAVIPVTQTAVSIIAHPPSGCTVENILNEDLERVFAGQIKKWSEIDGAKGGASCEKAIERVVRSDGSGTTYQLKHYFFTINGTALACTAGALNKWDVLQPNGGPPNPNTTWPESANCSGGATATALLPEKGGSGAVALVKKVEGTIGYAALADAKGGTVTILKVQNNGLKLGEKDTKGKPIEPFFADPNVVGVELANCGGAKYSIPGKGANLDWSGVYGSNHKIGGTTYPICTLTWILAAEDSTLIFGETAGLTIKEYLSHIVASKLDSNYYAPLPLEVEEAAKEAFALVK